MIISSYRISHYSPPQLIWEFSSKKLFRRCYHDRSCSIRLYLYIYIYIYIYTQVSLIVLTTLMNHGTWRYRRDAFVSVTKRTILREAIIMLIIYPAEIFIERVARDLDSRRPRDPWKSRITRVSFAFFPPLPQIDITKRFFLLFFYQFTLGIKKFRA